MLDFFVIVTKGGIRLWCSCPTIDIFRVSINTFLKSLILKENAGMSPFIHDSRAIKFYVDNEFDLLFIAAYQNVLQLNYVDKFLTAIALEFRDKYKNELEKSQLIGYNTFQLAFDDTLKRIEVEERDKWKNSRPMKTFGESEKSKKTVGSMIVSGKNKPIESKSNNRAEQREPEVTKANNTEVISMESAFSPDSMEEKRRRLKEKLKNKKAKESPSSPQPHHSPVESPVQKENGKKVKKENRRWDGAAVGKEAAALDFSSCPAKSAGQPGAVNGGDHYQPADLEAERLVKLRGLMQESELNEVEVSSGDDEEEEVDDDEEELDEAEPRTQNGGSVPNTSGRGGLMSGLLRGLRLTASQRQLTHADIAPSLEQLQDRLVAKNVASEIAQRVCDSVAEGLVGSSLGTFERVSTRVRNSLEEVCARTLASGRRVDVLRDALDAKANGRPYSIVFCGVNGVGKSTNLAKIAFWLNEKGFRVLIAACDTFRSGAVEQLKTHVRKLSYIHPPLGGQAMVELYEQGYGRDAASIARSAIKFARDQRFDVVLVDTAGRMQDNAPLMRSLTLLINTNKPDLVLFVGEALVGNEAVDQLVKFNQSLVDHSTSADSPAKIGGIVLTKFDTIDDKVGAAISMAYISGQPIVFVGTGQTYTDLRQLSVRAVVKALMK